MPASSERTSRHWFWFATLLGAMVPVVTSLGISLCISIVYSWIYTSNWGAPSAIETAVIERAITRIQAFGGWCSYGFLLAIAYALSRRITVPPWRAGLLLGLGCWAGSVPFVLVYQPAVGFRFVFYLGFAVAVAVMGTLVGSNSRSVAHRLLRVAGRVRQASSLQAIVEVMAMDAMRGPAPRAVLFEKQGDCLGPLVDSGQQVERFSAIDNSEFTHLRQRRGLIRLETRWLLAGAKWPFPVGRDAYGLFIEGRDGPGGVLLLVPGKGGSVPRRERDTWQAIAEQIALAWHRCVLIDQVREVTRQREREHLAHEIHDGLAQDLISAVLHLEAAQQQLAAGDVAQSAVAKAEAIVRDCLTTARELAWSSWQRGGNRTNDITEAMSLMLQHWSSQTSIAGAMEVVGTPRQLPEAIDELLLGAARESLNNVRKHANAANVRVTLTFLPEHLALDVCDNGSGFHAQPDTIGHASRGGFGLVALRERVMRHNGQFLIETSQGEGATVSIQLPLTGAGLP